MAQPYRILSFDGGGLRGAFSARVLTRLAGEFPALVPNASMLAGTSTGSIIAVGLAQGKTPTELVDLYRKIGPAVFQKTMLDDLEHLWGITHSKYGTANRLQVLSEELQDVPLKQLEKDVVVATFDLGNDVARDQYNNKCWAPKFYHNVSGPDSDGDVSCIEVMMKSSAAPIYFPIFKNYVDGGVIANNPAMCAVAQALDPRNDVKHAHGDIRLLSIGTGSSPATVSSVDGEWGLTQWGMKIIDLVSDASVGLPDFQCRQILGDCYRRIDTQFREPMPMDDPSKITELVAHADQIDIGPYVTWLNEFWV